MLLCRQQAEPTEHAKCFLCKSILQQGGRGASMNNPFLCDLQDKIQPCTLRALSSPATSEPLLVQPEAVDEPWAAGHVAPVWQLDSCGEAVRPEDAELSGGSPRPLARMPGRPAAFPRQMDPV